MKTDPAHLLSKLKPGFMYRDHRLLEQGAYRELALKFRKQARRQMVLFSVLSSVFALLGIVQLVESLDGPDTVEVVLAVSYVVIGMASLAFWTWTTARTVVLSEHVLELIPQVPLPRKRDPDAVSLPASFDRVTELWSPRVVAALNDYRFKIARIEGEFVWHAHEDTDEAFHVIDGKLRLEFRDGHVDMGPGDLYVVPAGVEHRPVAAAECRILLVEPEDVVNTGTAGGPRTVEQDVWV